MDTWWCLDLNVTNENGIESIGVSFFADKCCLQYTISFDIRREYTMRLLRWKKPRQYLLSTRKMIGIHTAHNIGKWPLCFDLFTWSIVIIVAQFSFYHQCTILYDFQFDCCHCWNVDIVVATAVLRMPLSFHSIVLPFMLDNSVERGRFYFLSLIPCIYLFIMSDTITCS